MRLVLLFSLSVVCALAAFGDDRPNVVLIMADDMGFSDIGCYGGEIQTPNLDMLAAEGLRFTQFYNGARCCPTRASLLTGVYAHEAGVGHMTNEEDHRFDYGHEAYRGELNRNCVTLAEAVRPSGYEAWMVGKWHVGTARGMWPLDRGFERYYGIVRGACNYFRPDPDKLLVLDQEPVPEVGDDFYTTDAFTDHAIQFIQEQADDVPFFLYVAYNAPHWPLHAWPEDIAKYRDRYRGGWDALREERFARQKAMGLIAADWKLSSRDADVPAWTELPKERQDELALRMAIYAAQIDRLDQNVGRLVSALKKGGKLENTVILFIVDNGACAEGGNWGGGPAEQLETKEGYFLTYGRGWANASNTPFKRYKHWVHEGGIASPLVAHWPKGIPERKRGSYVREPAHIVDILPTLLELADGAYPETYKDNTIHAAAGKSLVPLLEGDPLPAREAPLFWEHEGNRAVRDGHWKLVAAYAGGKLKWELYDMRTDRTETHDVSAEHPEIVKDLAAQYDAWAKRCGVVDWKVLQHERKNKK